MCTISAWTVENDMGQPKYLAKMVNKCLSETEAPILESFLFAFNSLTKTVKTTKIQ